MILVGLLVGLLVDLLVGRMRPGLAGSCQEGGVPREAAAEPAAPVA